MRLVRYSVTFAKQLDLLLAQGEPKFGARVIDAKRELVYDTIDHRLAASPKREPDPELGLCVYSIAKTPFVVVYDFDDDEVHAYFLLHRGQDRREINSTEVEW
jgi:hypothetical protein